MRLGFELHATQNIASAAGPTNQISVRIAVGQPSNVFRFPVDESWRDTEKFTEAAFVAGGSPGIQLSLNRQKVREVLECGGWRG
jgi:hypothetical protein